MTTQSSSRGRLPRDRSRDLPVDSRVALLARAASEIGTSLDITQTAQELTEVSVPAFADCATVDVSNAVARGDEPDLGTTHLLRAAFHGNCPAPYLCSVGDCLDYAPDSPHARCMLSGMPVRASSFEKSSTATDDRKAAGEGKTLDEDAYFLLAVPMKTRGKTLGVVAFWRAQPFGDADLVLAEELVSRTALKVDNASRYTHDHLLVESMQRGFLPQEPPEQNAVDAASRYLPAQTGAGGDWYDIIPLSGARVALVVGDVVGHGIHAAITMNQLRTTVRNFASSDSPPEELVSHLCDFVARLGVDESATCLYAVYNPTTRMCTFTRAGHPPPLLVLPDGSVRLPDPPPGLPLGLAYRPFETVELAVPAGSKIVLYTDGLIEKRHQDLDVGISRLADVLAAKAALPPDEMCGAVLDAMVDGRPTDDIALLIAATCSTDAHYAHWDVPRDPAAVAPVRNEVAAQIEEWNLPELSFSTELIVSELVTNAIRYTAGPVELRLILDQSLFCEVSDGSSIHPRMRRALTTDEGGRGLFLVAQLSTRYGTRYTSDGKVIWSEQTLPGVIDWARC